MQDLTAGAHGAGPGRLFSRHEPQITHSLEDVLELPADRSAVLLQLLAIDLSFSPLVPVVKQLLLQQFTPDLTAGTAPLGDRRQVPPQVGPAAAVP